MVTKVSVSLSLCCTQRGPNRLYEELIDFEVEIKYLKLSFTLFSCVKCLLHSLSLVQQLMTEFFTQLLLNFLEARQGLTLIFLQLNSTHICTRMFAH